MADQTGAVDLEALKRDLARHDADGLGEDEDIVLVPIHRFRAIIAALGRGERLEAAARKITAHWRDVDFPGYDEDNPEGNCRFCDGYRVHAVDCPWVELHTVLAPAPEGSDGVVGAEAQIGLLANYAEPEEGSDG